MSSALDWAAEFSALFDVKAETPLLDRCELVAASRPLGLTFVAYAITLRVGDCMLPGWKAMEEAMKAIASAGIYLNLANREAFGLRFDREALSSFGPILFCFFILVLLIS